MNKLTVIGNLTRDPELRTTTEGVNVCNFMLAVNRPRRQGQEQQADYFRITAWREKGENCAKFLSKGKKVCVIGPVAVRTYTANDGNTRAQMEVTADEVEFLSPAGQSEPEPKKDTATGFEQVETDELPFE